MGSSVHFGGALLGGALLGGVLLGGVLLGGVLLGGSLRREQVIAAGWQAMPILEQWTASPSPRSQLRQVSVHAMQVLSRSP